MTFVARFSTNAHGSDSKMVFDKMSPSLIMLHGKFGEVSGSQFGTSIPFTIDEQSKVVAECITKAIKEYKEKCSLEVTNPFEKQNIFLKLKGIISFNGTPLDLTENTFEAENQQAVIQLKVGIYVNREESEPKAGVYFQLQSVKTK